MDIDENKIAQGREALKNASRLVVKLGTHVVMQPSGELAMGRLYGIIESVAMLLRQGRQVILVSSGAVGLGSGRTGINATLLPDKQACAAVGQVLLMAVYEQAFARFQIPVAQLLLTEQDFTSRTGYLNLRNTFNRLLDSGVLPVVNENDPVSTAEIEVAGGGNVFGDNDQLSALVMSKIDADALVVLSDVDGLYEHPGPDRGGALIPAVEVAHDTMDHVSGKAGAFGRGGMRTKLAAMQIAAASGGVGVIANGWTPGVLDRIFSGETVGTLFIPSRKLSSRKRWIAFAGGTNGRVAVTAGARQALEEQGASLLFAGVVSVDGDFEQGDVLAIVDEAGEEFARGMTNHSANVARRLIGKHTRDVVAITNAPNFDAFINRDNLVLTKGSYGN